MGATGAFAPVPVEQWGHCPPFLCSNGGIVPGHYGTELGTENFPITVCMHRGGTLC